MGSRSCHQPLTRVPISGWRARQHSTRVGSSAALWKMVMENHFCAVGRGQLALPEHRKQIFLVSPARERRRGGALHLTQHTHTIKAPAPSLQAVFQALERCCHLAGRRTWSSAFCPPGGGICLPPPVHAAPAVTEGAAQRAAPADRGTQQPWWGNC